MSYENIKKLKEDFSELERYLVVRKAQRELLESNQQKFAAELAETLDTLSVIDKTRVYLQAVAWSARREASDEIEKVVTDALQYVFGVNYSFKIILKPDTSTRAEADFIVQTKVGDKIINSVPTMGKGGGVVDIIAGALKLALLSQLNYDGIIWMDEPFKQVSAGYSDAASKLLKFMSEYDGRQVIMITHNTVFTERCDKVMRVHQTPNGVSYCKEV